MVIWPFIIRQAASTISLTHLVLVRENLPNAGFRSFEAKEEGSKVRMRAESFGDHYSQARQFFLSQTASEQLYIIKAITFELSKVETLAIRERMVSHLRNIDNSLTGAVAERPGLPLKRATLIFHPL